MDFISFTQVRAHAHTHRVNLVQDNSYANEMPNL